MTSGQAKFFQQTVLLVVQYFHSEEAPCSFPSVQRKAGPLYVSILNRAGLSRGTCCRQFRLQVTVVTLLPSLLTENKANQAPKCFNLCRINQGWNALIALKLPPSTCAHVGGSQWYEIVLQYSHGPTFGQSSSAKVANYLISSRHCSQVDLEEQGLAQEEHCEIAGVPTSGKRAGFPGQQPWPTVLP